MPFDRRFRVISICAMPTSSLAEIAKIAGVSKATVSLALRDNRKISEKTRIKVKEVARSVGYVPDPLMSVYQSRVRSLHPPKFQSCIGWIVDEADENKQFHSNPMLLAAKDQAAKMGYTIEPLYMPDLIKKGGARDVERFQGILRSRGIHALIMVQLLSADLIRADWSEFAVILLGSRLSVLEVVNPGESWEPHYHQVVPDSFHNVRLAYRILREQGAGRIGFVVSNFHDTVREGRLLSAYAGLTSKLNTRQKIPPFFFDNRDLEGCVESFRIWKEKYRPEGILTCTHLVQDWCRRLGYAVPEDVVLAHVERSSLDRGTGLSGVDQLLGPQGVMAVNLVTGLLQRNERGMSEFPTRLLIPGVWRSAKTTRVVI